MEPDTIFLYRVNENIVSFAYDEDEALERITELAEERIGELKSEWTEVKLERSEDNYEIKIKIRNLGRMFNGRFYTDTYFDVIEVNREDEDATEELIDTDEEEIEE